MRITSQNGFKGIDERINTGNGISTAVTSVNLRVTESGSMIKRPNIRDVHLFKGGDIDGIWCGTLKGKERLVVSAEGYLYGLEPHKAPAEPELISEIPAGECMMFCFNGILYIKNGSFYARYDGDSFSEVEGYIPLVAMSCTPSGEGTLYEQINLISDKRRQLFSPDGESVLYRLAEEGIDSIVSIKLDGNEYEGNYSLNNGNAVSFESPIEKGLNSLEIVYSKPNSESDKQRIFGCTNIMLFGGNSDGRAFLWGNESHPNIRFHSELADGVPSVEYFPVNAFTVIGNSRISCIVQQYDRQLIFNENEAYYSYCELKDDGLGNLISSFPVFSLNGSKGCIVKANGCIIDNRPVTLCDDGLNMWESTSVENEKNAICFSGAINESIRDAIASIKDSIMFFDLQSSKELFFIAGDKAFIYNYGAGVWYSYDDFSGKHHFAYGKSLYFARRERLHIFRNDFTSDESIECIYQSPLVNAGSRYGQADLTELEADVHISGGLTLEFTLTKGNSDSVTRKFIFSEDTDRYSRISFRPSLRRAIPFSLKIKVSGHGVCTVHGISIKTNEKERSSRFGLQ